MKKLAPLLLLILVLAPLDLHSRPREIFKIELGNDYEHYSKEELRRRVWQLERAVSQLQEQVFQLAMDQQHRPIYDRPMWTCHLQSFGKTHTATGSTRASALADTLKKCSENSHAIHCKESDVSCDNR